MIITSGGIGQYVTIRAWSADGRLQADHPVGRLGEPLHCDPAALCPTAELHACSSYLLLQTGSCSMGCWLYKLCQSTLQCLVEVCLPACSHMWHHYPVCPARPLLARQDSSWEVACCTSVRPWLRRHAPQTAVRMRRVPLQQVPTLPSCLLHS